MSRVEPTILRNLVEDEDYARKVAPYIKPEYFLQDGERIIFQKIIHFYRLYNTKPTIEAIKIELGQEKKLTETVAKVAQSVIDSFNINTPSPDSKWLLTKTEEFCQDKAIYLAMMESIQIADGKSKKGKGMIPELLKDALAITFDPSIGHDYIEDADARFTYYTNVEARLPFDVDCLNDATNGGIPTKTLNMILAGIHVGKSASMCSLAATYLLQGKNVLYITMEMSEEETGRRIDANLLDIPISELDKIPEEFFKGKINQVKARTTGALVIKEFPTGGANVNHFRSVIDDLALKKNFRPDVIFIDYINLCTSTRFNAGQSNSYEVVQGIAQEVRGLAKEYELPIWSATQLNRNGMKSSDPEMTDVSESMGLPAVCDLVWILTRNEEMDKKGYLMLKQVKNRYRDKSHMPRFLLGFDRVKMRLHDVNPEDQKRIQQNPDDSSPVSLSPPMLSKEEINKQVWNI